MVWKLMRFYVFSETKYRDMDLKFDNNFHTQTVNAILKLIVVANHYVN
ncbi:hypothetical protein X975_02665, partial [Stegodyphus mimosarum]